ncbi:MAG: hypothetical protein IPN33_16550 [Saprospiraceae bacterium]|nr:hypothetical protein [Saprospiraceae bacterium]
MPVYTEEIKKYDVAYYGGGKNVNNYPYRAIIGLRREDGSLIGAAYFHRKPDTMPNTDSRGANGYVYIHYTWEDYPHVLDILRNEKPTISRYVDGWELTSINTNLEPAGEGEI